MQESALKKLAIACSLIGIIALLIISQVRVPPTFDGSQEGRVRATGKVISILRAEKVTRIEVDDQGKTLTVVAFNSMIPELRQGMEVDIEADVSEFQGKKELVAYRIQSREPNPALPDDDESVAPQSPED